MPLMLELDDINALWDRKLPVDRYARLLEESFDGLYEGSRESGLLMAFNLHPWLIGQPFRIRYLDQAWDTWCDARECGRPQVPK